MRVNYTGLRSLYELVSHAIAPIRLALLGWPVKHSLSPPMQHAGLQALGLTGSYELVEVSPGRVDEEFARLSREGYAGWNITVPHKGAAACLADEVDPPAALANSVNTIVNRNGRLLGYSTDGYGLETAIREELGIDVRQARVAFLGTGGAARATAMHFALCGVRTLTLANRTVAKAQSLAADIRAGVPGCDASALPLADTDALTRALRGCNVLVQATSLGLHDGDPLPAPVAALHPGLAVIDMIYGQTPFRAAAAAAGCPTTDGRGMLLYQGVRSLELWTGRPAPVSAMREALDRALRCRAAADKESKR